AQRFKRRTEASARFEKSLDPNQNTQVLLRFLKILEHEQIQYTTSGDIASLGIPVQQQKILVSHDFLERRLGVTLSQEFVISILTQLDFAVEYEHDVYSIMVPTTRSTKDVTIKEDIVEEVGRFFGYTNIPPLLPYKPTILANVQPIMRVRT